MDVDNRIKYMHHIIRETVLKKYKHVLLGCKDLAKVISGYQWELGVTKDVTMEQF